MMNKYMYPMIFWLLIFLLFPAPVFASSYENSAFNLSSESTQLTMGVGITNDLIGGIVKNGLGEPRHSFSLNTVFGFSYTEYYGANSVDQIFATAKELSDKNKPEELEKAVKKVLAKSNFNYFRVGTAFLIYPLVVQYGWSWLPYEHTRFELGLGLPVLLHFGLNIDF